MARGLASSRPDPFVFGQNPRNDVPNSNSGNNDTNSKTVRSSAINTGISNLVMLMWGQSNAANVNPSTFTPVNASAIDNLNVLNGQMYAATDPILGCSSSYLGPGNVSLRLADKLITGGKFARVIIVNIAIGGTSIGMWANGGVLNQNFAAAMARLAQRGYVPGGAGLTFCAPCMQGESDVGMSQSTYTTLFGQAASTLLGTGFNGRIFVNKETWLAGVVNSAVQAAQVALPNGTTIFAGADADSLNATYRQADNTHFNDTGAASVATLMYNAMVASGAPF